MTDRQTLQLTAYDRLMELRRLNQPLVASKPKVMAAFDDLGTTLEKIRKKDEKIIMGSGGAKGSFKIAHALLLECTLKVQGPLIAFASETANQAILEAAGFPVGFYQYAGQQALYDRASVVYAKAQPHEAALVAEYGLGATDLAGFEEALKQYQQALPAKNQASKSQKAAHDQLADLFAEAAAQVRILSTKMLVFRMTQPEFYADFLLSKRVGGYKRTKTPENPEAPEA